MPKGEWNPKEQWLTSKERFEEMKDLLKAGDTETVIGLLEDILDEMENS